ncbi:MAG TPA: hypothetical protein VNE40_00675 [Candidatus Dormibacteraeota bacterium]|nr:hypothetical protein [Candidatus Dormibacteraeota bacterium]
MINRVSHFINHYQGPIIFVFIGLGVLAIIGFFLFYRRPRRLNQISFTKRWHELQTLCAKKATWPLAIIEADKLLDEALKKRRFKGKTTGERLVAAQHTLSFNEMVWFGHKLRNKLVHGEYSPAGKREVKQALLGFLQALKDLGAIKSGK